MTTTNPSGTLTATARENLDVVKSFNVQQDAEVTPIRGAIERISAFFGSPAYFAFVIGFVVLWVGVNEWGEHAGWQHVDPAPFFWLQGLVSSNALLLTVAVLIRQNRMAELAEHRAHLDLQINLLTEQKVSKILQQMNQALGERHGHAVDNESHELATPADPEALLKAIKQTNDA